MREERWEYRYAVDGKRTKPRMTSTLLIPLGRQPGATGKPEEMAVSCDREIKTVHVEYRSDPR
jgi:hypothetical protein